MDRRQFIQKAGAVTLLQQTLRSAPTVIRAGLLGTKHSHTTGKLTAMQDNPDYQVAGICENDAAAKAEAQSDPRFKGLKWMSEAEMLADKSIDLVVVECNVWEALPWAKKVIDAGKHLHQEKPVSVYCLQYLNRLSDWLFVLARILMKDEKEVLWAHERKKTK